MKASFLIPAALLLMTACTSEPEWTALLDENLSQWEMYQSFEFSSPEYHGKAPVDADGNLIEPIGYNKNYKDLFTVDMVNGEPVLHVNGATYGCVFTKESFSDYILTLKVKFGEAKFHPRKDKALDSGVLYHSQGECGVDYWRTWKRAQEFQMMEGGTDEGNYGDYWPVSSARCTVRASLKDGEYWFDPDGEKLIFGSKGNGGDHIRVIDRGAPHGEWTEVMLVCFGDKSVYIVGGEVVMALEDLGYVENGEVKPMTGGQIQLQSEGGETYYKDIRIRHIDSMPAEYAKYFN